MPCSHQGKVVGVIQLINKREGAFESGDEEIMNSFLIIAGPVLAQSQLFHSRETTDDESTEFSGKMPVKQKVDHQASCPGFLSISATPCSATRPPWHCRLPYEPPPCCEPQAMGGALIEEGDEEEDEED